MALDWACLLQKLLWSFMEERFLWRAGLIPEPHSHSAFLILQMSKIEVIYK